MFSLGQRFAISIAVALLLALAASAVSATVPPSPSHQQEPEETPVPLPPLQGVVIVTPTDPDVSETPPPEPREIPEPTPVESAPPPAEQPTSELAVEPAPIPRPAPPVGETTQYQVERGDTLYSIARSHGITVAELQEANGLTGTAIQAGWTLIIPISSRSPDPTTTPIPTEQATATLTPTPAPTHMVPTAAALPLDRPITAAEEVPPSSEHPSLEEFDFLTTAERYTEQFLRWIEPLISGASPFVFVGALVGVVNSCLFYLVLGRSLALFIPFMLIGAAAAVVGVTVSRQLPESGPMIGEVDLVVASVATWLTLLIARSFRL
jgi:LysM repeat protein